MIKEFAALELSAAVQPSVLEIHSWIQSWQRAAEPGKAVWKAKCLHPRGQITDQRGGPGFSAEQKGRETRKTKEPEGNPQGSTASHGASKATPFSRSTSAEPTC